MKLIFLFIFLFIFACQEGKSPSPSKSTPVWHLYLNQKLLAWIQIKKHQQKIHYHSQARLGHSSPMLETHYIISQIPNHHSGHMGPHDSYYIKWKQSQSSHTQVKNFQLIHIDQCPQLKQRKHWHIRFTPTPITTFNHQHHIDDIHITPINSDHAYMPLPSVLWPWMLNDQFHSYCQSFQLNTKSVKGPKYFQVPLIDPSTNQWGIDDLSVTCPQKDWWLGTTLQTLRFKQKHATGKLKIVPNTIQKKGIPIIGEWTQSQNQGKLNWFLSLKPWQGWSQHDMSDQWFNHLSQITLNHSLPWNTIRWVSWDVKSPIKPINTTRQKVQVLSDHHFQVLSKKGTIDLVLSLDESVPTISTVNLAERKQALQHTRTYPHQHQTIQNLLKELVKYSTTKTFIHTSSTQEQTLEKVKLILIWMKHTMTHQLQSSSVDVLNVAQSLTGDCNEWSALFVTLCRALGIPAQQVFGVVHTDQHMGYHAWARVLLNHQWHEIDPLWNQWQVDVSHLAWAAGDQSSQNVIAPLITQLQLKIQAYEAMGKSK